MKDYNIVYADELDVKYKKDIIQGLSDHAFQQRELAKISACSFVILSDNEELVAGVQCYNYHGCFDINLLYVMEEDRGKGYGSKLINKVEQLAYERNCLFMTLDTMDFQAKPFYEKHGYEVEFVREGFDRNSVMYYMRKTLK